MCILAFNCIDSFLHGYAFQVQQKKKIPGVFQLRWSILEQSPLQSDELPNVQSYGSTFSELDSPP